MAAGDAVERTVDGSRGTRLEGLANLLVLAPGMDEDARRAYYEQLLPNQPDETDVLAIDYRRTPDQLLDEWRRHAGERPRRVAVVSVNEATRSTATVGAGGARTHSGRPGETPQDTVVCVESPADLTGIGIRVSEYLSKYGGPETMVAFESVTALLQFVGLQPAFRFLHVLTNRVASVGAVGHYHVEPAAHDERDVATLASLFDAVAEYDDGEWALQVR